mmetsp:Transcript_47826/g.57649  ORF Transcript_47826/g.57649 Transcript_47826/m.57649 type:complete len:124 (+) Transcript_47826:430-801(+)
MNTPIDNNIANNDSKPGGSINHASCAFTVCPQSDTVTNIGDCVFTYKPGTVFVGSDKFNYRFCDTNGQCKIATATTDIELGEEMLLLMQRMILLKLPKIHPLISLQLRMIPIPMATLMLRPAV